MSATILAHLPNPDFSQTPVEVEGRTMHNGARLYGRLAVRVEKGSSLDVTLFISTAEQANALVEALMDISLGLQAGTEVESAHLVGPNVAV